MVLTCFFEWVGTVQAAPYDIWLVQRQRETIRWKNGRKAARCWLNTPAQSSLGLVCTWIILDPGSAFCNGIICSKSRLVLRFFSWNGTEGKLILSQLTLIKILSEKTPAAITYYWPVKNGTPQSHQRTYVTLTRALQALCTLLTSFPHTVHLATFITLSVLLYFREI